jgi:predicted alpha-1,2-mannosidase
MKTRFYQRVFSARFLMIQFLLVCACSTIDSLNEETLPDLTQYVDPYIGSGFHGHVFVGANVPFGAVQLGPTEIKSGWDWSSGYHYSDSVISGFAHTHLSGTGIGDLGDILVMPVTGPLFLEKGTPDDFTRGYSAAFSHADEVVRPGYYKVDLHKYGVTVELTTTERVGFHKYSFKRNDVTNIIFDLGEGIGWDATVTTLLEKVNDSTIAGYRYSTGWAKDQRIYFTAVFSRPMKLFSIYDDKVPMKGDSASAKALMGIAQFPVAPREPVYVKVGISPVSMANAMANINKEIPHWDFDLVRKKASESWNRELARIQVEGKSEKDKKVFYTAMYHTMVAPSIFNDVNGDYLGTDKKVYNDTTFTNLTTFSLWDTYRAAHSLYTIVQPDRVNDMVSSMLRIYEQQGKLPVWHLMGSETNTMPGNSALPVIADAYLKGFSGFDRNVAYEAMRVTALGDERGLKSYKQVGYIPAETEIESVAKGLEYSIDDWSFAQVCRAEGKIDDFETFSKRGQNYKNYFDPATRFMRGRISDSKWRTPFNPFIARHEADDFTEGNAWQYTWLVPHDVEGLMMLMGGEKPFLDKLDSLFIAEGEMGEEASSDITGLIGQYAHGNEPSHHITYMYAYAGQQFKTAEKVRYILDSLYADTPEGLCGNEDVGQMSAWFVFSSIGFYPVNPANGAYVFGSPLFDKVSISLPGNKRFTVNVIDNTAKNVYIQEVKLNGQKYTKAYLLYEDIMKGGELEISMGAKPSQWGTAEGNRPKSVVH